MKNLTCGVGHPVRPSSPHDPRYNTIYVVLGQCTRRPLVTLLTGLPLLVACWLLWDLAAGRAGWIGLRSTPFSSSSGLLLATLNGLLFLSLGWLYGFNVLVTAAMVLLSLPLHMLLSLLMRRDLGPDIWAAEGEREHQRITRVVIPAPEFPIPGLVFEPRQGACGSILLVHGAGSHKTFYSWPLIDALVRANFRVCAIDVDGHGENQRTLSFPRVLECVDLAVGWLRERDPWVGVVGISLGGCIAARAAAEGLDLDALAIIGSPSRIDITRKVVRNERHTLFRLGTWSLHRYGGTLSLIRAWRTERTRATISTADLIRALELPGSLQRARCPLWLCYGSRDLIAPMSDATAIAEQLPDARFTVIPHATHLSLPLDHRLTGDLSTWLRREHVSWQRAR